MSTTVKAETLRSTLNKGDPALIGTAFAKMKAGRMFTPLTRTFTGLASGTTFDLTAIDATGETVGPSNENRVGAACIQSLRVTAGTAPGPRQITDAGGTTSATVAKVSADGKTITFEAAVTAFVISYLPCSAVSMEAADATLGGSP